MQIRHFKIYLRERGLHQSVSLSMLKGIRLGIDAQTWLKLIMASLQSVGSSVGIGGAPSDLVSAIEADLARYRKHDITPIFVFNGLALPRKDKPFSIEDTRPNVRNMGWKSLWNGNQTQALETWVHANSVYATDLVPLVIRTLQKNGVEFIRAPYSAMGQLEYLYNHRKQPIHAVYGFPGQLMFNVDRVITEINFEKETFSWVTKYSVLHDLRISKEQLLDICILAGFDWCPTFPPLDKYNVFTFKSVHEIVKSHYTGHNVIQAYLEDPDVKHSNYYDAYCRAYCAIKYHLVLRDDGVVCPLNATNVPGDLHEIFGCRLPDWVYQHMARGLVQPHLFNLLNSGAILEYPPLDNGESTEYRKFIVGPLAKLNEKLLALYTSHLHNFYQKRAVYLNAWFDAPKGHFINHSGVKAEFTWPVVYKLSQADKDGSFKDENIVSVMGLATEDIKDHGGQQPLNDIRDISASVRLTVLHNSGLLVVNKKLSGLGAAVLDELKDPEVLTMEESEALILALILAREGVLSGKAWSTSYERARSKLPEAEQAHISLIARAATLLSISTKVNELWAGPFNRDLLAFSSAARALSRVMENVGEASLLSLVLTGQVSVDALQNCATISKKLPFHRDLNAAMGVLVQIYLEHTVSHTEQEALEYTAKQAQSAGNPREDVKRALGFFRVLASVVMRFSEGDYAQVDIASKPISKAVIEEFVSAKWWLEKRSLI